jgi:hypothetical protein
MLLMMFVHSSGCSMIPISSKKNCIKYYPKLWFFKHCVSNGAVKLNFLPVVFCCVSESILLLFRLVPVVCYCK